MDIPRANNSQLKARAQCAYRRMQNTYNRNKQTPPQKTTATTTNNKKQQKAPRAHQDVFSYHTTDNHTITKKARQTTAKKQNKNKDGRALRLLTILSIHKRIARKGFSLLKLT